MLQLVAAKTVDNGRKCLRAMVDGLTASKLKVRRMPGSGLGLAELAGRLLRRLRRVTLVGPGIPALPA